YRHLVEEDPDLILFLGDYIYEGDPGSRQSVRLHQNPEPMDIGGYRIRYATYKTDPLLQAAHAAAAWMVIWDDHEVVNDYGADSDESGDPVAFLRRRAAAYQAYFEHMPLRRRSLPVGPDMQLYRTLDWGGLSQFQLVDNRQYRQPTPCPAPGASSKLIPDCDARRDPSRSLLGQRQEAWLLDTLASSRARWNLLTQQTLFGPMNLRDPADMSQVRYSNDGWDGAPATRDRITARWAEAGTANPLVLGGDVHAFAAASVENGVGGPVVASEFVGGSITSLGMDMAVADRIKGLNPRMDLFDTSRRGYTRIDLTPARAEIAFRALDDARDLASPISTLKAWVVEDGRAGALPA
ncbi:MAG: alkaline phosphatase D family protein, partial [Alphaproteobacteria bacterium]|nr:alkaline phosphatase D family protein [Alphaproteobacteria bacterium]